jgi:cytidyltransferase-like protein
MASLIPKSIHPNTLTFVGLLINIIGYNYAEATPLGGFIFGVSVITYMNMDAIDGMHARNTKTGSVLGEFVDHMADGISSSLMVDGFLKCVGAHNNFTRNLSISLAANNFMSSHIDAIVNGYITFDKLYDTSLILPLIASLSFISPLIGITLDLSNSIYYMVYLLSCYVYLDKTKKLDNDNKNIFNLYLLIRSAVIFTTMNDAPYFIDQNLLYESIICKMTKKPINSYVLLLPLMYKIFPYYTNVFGVISSIYYIYHISQLMNIPVFTKKTKIYCCGVFDLLHLGHMELFRKCGEHADEVIVGVHTDKDVESYKRTPYIPEDVRYQMVNNIKYVSKVIEGAPLYTTEQFLKDNNIDMVAISEEYEKPDDKWYEEVRRTTKYVIIPRYEGLSTTQILQKIKEN